MRFRFLGWMGRCFVWGFGTILSGACVAALGAGAEGRLDGLVFGEGLWERGPAQIEESLSEARPQWLDERRSRVRFFGRGLTLFGGRVALQEANGEFKEGKLSGVSVSLFNRADNPRGAATQEQFGALVGGYRDLLTETLGVKPMDRGKDNASVVKAHVLQWNKPPSVYLLEYSFEKENKGQGKAFQAEFVRLRVYPIPKQAMVSELGMRANVPLSRESLVRNLRTEAGGDVVLRNVPMVDQGPKGYCVVASCERVLRYLGLEVDQHEMAAVAESRAREGTSYLKMLEGLKRMTGRLKVRTREVLSWNGEEFERMLADYNRAARKAKKAEINLAGLRVIDLAEVYGAMDPVILKESRSAPGKAGYGKFQRAVAETLARGVPLLWTVELGLYEEPERPAQGRGGHMRLIIGYNSRTQEILFSDSWGERHALKRMPMDCAYAMTTGMCFLEPIP